MRAALTALLVATPLIVTASPASAWHDSQSRPDSYTTTFNTPLTVSAPGVLANDYTGAGALTAYYVSGPTSAGSVTLNGDGSFTYTPALGFTGTDTFYYRADSASWVGNTASVTITVPNTAPVANADAGGTTAEDTALYGSGLLVNDSDLEGSALSASVSTGPANGSVVVNADGTFAYTPTANFNGSDSFTYRAFDGSAYSNPATVSLTVTPVDDAPVGVDDVYTTPGGTPLTVTAPGILANDIDVDGDVIYLYSLTQPANGSVWGTQEGGITYTPPSGFEGVATIPYGIRDAGYTLFGTGQVRITVGNTRPAGSPESFTTTEDTAVGGNVLTNDSDANSGDSLTAVLVSGPAAGALTLNGDGTFVYTPNADVNGSDSFVYRASDGTDVSSDVTVSLTVTPVNDAPRLADQTITTAEDTAVAGTSGATEVEGEVMVQSIVAVPSAGSVVLNPGTGAFVYTPDANTYGTDSFDVRACDPSGACTTATVTVTVTSVVEGPNALNFARTLPEEGSNQTQLPNRTTDADHDPATDLTYSVVTGPANGTAVLTGSALRYVPAPDFTGTDSLTWQACDPDGACDTATATYTVTPLDDAPVAADATLTTDEDTAVSGTVAVTDVDGDVAFTFAVADAPTAGSVALDATTGAFTYTPDAHVTGTDTFTVEVCDASGLCDIATITVVVGAVNDGPVTADLAISTDEDTAVTGTVPATDVDDPALTYAVTTDPLAGTVVLDASTGAFTFTPDADVHGTDAFVVEVCDLDLCASSTVTVVVAPVNDAPVAGDVALTTTEDTSVNGAVTASDVDSAVLTTTVATAPARGTVVLVAAGAFTYRPHADATGTDGFVLQVCDEDGGCTTAAVTVTVTPVNDAPAVDIVGDVTGTAGTEVILDASATDVDGDLLTYSWSQTSGPAATLRPGGAQLRFTPATAGVYGISVLVCDASGACATSAYTVTVAAAPVVPTPAAPTAPAAAAGPSLATTGFTLAPLGATAAALVLAGWFMVRRRRTLV